jgi:hypothetical protein
MTLTKLETVLMVRILRKTFSSGVSFCYIAVVGKSSMMVCAIDSIVAVFTCGMNISRCMSVGEDFGVNKKKR